MKFPVKRLLLTLAAALAVTMPAAGAAQGLPEFAAAMQEGLSEGLEAGVQQAIAVMDADLTLALETDSPRLEQGQSVTLRLTAGNPKPQEAVVTLTLKLPERVACAGETVWQATLPAATMNPETGAIEPGMATFERGLTLKDGGASENVTLEAEMGVGTRFYRARSALALGLPGVTGTADVTGAADGRIEPGAEFAYTVTIENAGAAAKAMPVELTLPQGVQAAGAMPAGFAVDGARIAGDVVAVAADAAGEPSSMTLTFPVRAEDGVPAGDEDAAKLLAGSLRVDGKLVPLARVQVCGPMITARLVADAQSVEAGEAMTLRVMVINSGLAGAGVRVRCALPEGLTLCTDETSEAQDAQQEQTAEDGEPDAQGQTGEDGEPDADDEQNESTQDEADEAAVLPEDDGGMPGAGEAVAAVSGGELVYDLYMEPASERSGGIVPSTHVIEIPVAATEAMDKVDEKLLGATLAWSVGGGEAQLGEAVALRVYRPQFLGLDMEQWMGIFWASLLMLATALALFFALRSKDDDYAYE